MSLLHKNEFYKIPLHNKEVYKNLLYNSKYQPKKIEILKNKHNSSLYKNKNHQNHGRKKKSVKDKKETR